MELTLDQDNAIKAIGRWMGQKGEWFFYLGGYAGTGKTTLMHHFINSLASEPTCLAPTGKAASVLQKRLDNAVVTTIHSALYKPVVPDITKLERLEAELLKDSSNGKLIAEIREEKRRLARLKINFSDNEDHAITPNSLVIVDEASMVTNKMMKDLKATGAKVLFVGDPGQLPPVGDPGYFTKNKPDAMLSQVMRQALDNPIVALSMSIRKGENISSNISNEHIQRRHKDGFDIAELGRYDQVLTGKNAIRRKINRIIRKQMGLGEAKMPQKGERLICLKNMHKFDNFFVNGVQCTSTSDSDVDNQGNWIIDLLYEGDAMNAVPYYHFPFEVHYNYMAEEDPWPARKNLVELDYSYAVTVHKSQGSEWPTVALVDDHLMEEQPGFRKRWLYTAVTRAKQKLLWVEM
jgi:exodeoxyribonuclease-5